MKEVSGGFQQPEVSGAPKIDWKKLREDPEALVQYVRERVSLILEREGNVSQPLLKRIGEGGLANGISLYYPDGFIGLKEDLDIALTPVELGIKKRKLAKTADGRDTNISQQDSILPIDGRGRIWSALKDKPEELAYLIEEEARTIVSSGVELNRESLRDAGLNRFLRVVGRYYEGGLRSLKDKLEIENQKPTHYWQELENIEEEAKKFLKESIELTHTQIKQANPSLSVAITKYYPGRIKALRKKLEVTADHLMNHWTEPENIEAGVREFLSEEGELELVLLRKKRPGLYNSIFRYYPGKMPALREKLGLTKIDPVEQLLEDYEEALLSSDNPVSFKEFVKGGESEGN